MNVVEKKVVIVGATAPDVVKIISAVNRAGHQRLSVEGFLDDDPSKAGGRFMGYPILGPTSLVTSRFQDCWVLNNVARDMATRGKVRARLNELGVTKQLTLVHPSVDVEYASIGQGSILHEGVNLGPECVLGEHCLLLANATVGHECLVGDLVFVGNNAILGARGEIGSGSFIGLNSIVLPYRKIGSSCMVGAGSVVIRDLEPETSVFGNPARAGVRPAAAVAEGV